MNNELNNQEQDDFKSILNEMDKQQALENNEVPKTNTFINQNYQENPETTKSVINNQTINSNIQQEKIELPKLDSTQTIGNVKKDKQKSPVNMLILFLALIIAIFFLPQITPYFSELLSYLHISSNEDIYGNNPPTPQTPETPKEEPIIETKYFNLENTTTGYYDSLEFSALTKTQENNNYQFTYTIKNTKTEAYDFNANKIYIDFYDENTTYLGRILITTNKLNSKASLTLTSLITDNIYNNASKITIGIRNIDDYPNIEIINNTLTCSLNNKTLTYTFNANKLSTIKEEYTYYKETEEKYTNDYIQTKTLIDSLARIEGVTAILVDNSFGFTTSVNIDYNIVNTDISSYNVIYYNKDTAPKTISYEMESRGYNCY